MCVMMLAVFMQIIFGLKYLKNKHGETLFFRTCLTLSMDN